VTNGRLVTFSFLMALYSSFGQTYFVGVFGPAVQAEFGLSHTLWGTIYLLGTLASAVFLPISGALIDRFRLRPFAIAVSMLLVIACLYTAWVPGPVGLVLAIFLLRHAGQGLASHVSVTSMARYFDRDRGRAIAIAAMGYTVGEAALPFLAVLLIAGMGWRWTYASAGIFIALTLIPAGLWLLRDHDTFHRRHIDGQARELDTGAPTKRSWTRAAVLRDARFYLLCPGILSSSLIVTAFFFHHLNIAAAKGWSGEWITGTYILYAGAGSVTMLVAGPLIDRFTAVRVTQGMLVPLILSCLLLALATHPFTVLVYMVILGVHSALALTSISALWAELYGVRNLGAIKSLYTALMVLSSALGPVIMGSLMDLGFSIAWVCTMFGVYAFIGNLLVVVALRMKTTRL
jgi:MFS family permease